MKKKLCFMLAEVILLVTLTCACSDGQGTKYTLAEPIEDESCDSIESAVPELSDEGTDDAADLTSTSELNQNGISEEVQLTDMDNGESQSPEIWVRGKQVEFYGCNSIFLCTLNGENYLLYYYPTMRLGVGRYRYMLKTSGKGETQMVQQNSVDFDINFGSFHHDDFDPEAIAAFMDEINDLLSYSVPLLNTDSNLLNTFEKEGQFYDSLWWLDDQEPTFIRDGSKSLLENLKDFQNTMTAVQEPAVSKEVDGLPITEPLKLEFYSGAGAWWTILTLNPDGSFVGDYTDANTTTVYVCQFHGKFGEVEKLTDAAWLLTISELEIDTSHSIGEEWDEVKGDYTYHYISSEPYGFEDADGTTLKPGAQFFLYSPDATGHEPGTELYGAEEFLSWTHKRREFSSEEDILGCWGLENIETGEGFVADPEEWWEGLDPHETSR